MPITNAGKNLIARGIRATPGQTIRCPGSWDEPRRGTVYMTSQDEPRAACSVCGTHLEIIIFTDVETHLRDSPYVVYPHDIRIEVD